MPIATSAALNRRFREPREADMTLICIVCFPFSAPTGEGGIVDCQRRPNVYTRDRPADGLLPSRVEVGDCLASPEQLRGRG